LTLLILSTLLPLIDSSIINVAVAKIGSEYAASATTAHWIVTAYILAGALTIPMTPWLIARLGTATAWKLALSVFLAGSALCAAAWNIDSLIAFRVLQGIGGGAVMPIVQTILVAAVGKDGMKSAMATIGVPAVVAPVLGPVIGGVLVDTAGWRSLFLINIPICVIALILGHYRLDNAALDRARRLDGFGALLCGTGLVMVLLGLSWLDGHDVATSLAWALVAIGAISLVAFTVWSLRAARHPLMQPTLFRQPGFAAVMMQCALVGAVFYGSLLLIPLYYTTAHHLDAFKAGLMLALQGIGALAARTAVKRLAGRISSQGVLAGSLALAVLGTMPLTVDSWAYAAPGYVGLVVRGFGLGAATVTMLAAAFEEAPAESAADASALTRVLLQVGGAAGTAAAGFVLHGQVTGSITFSTGFIAIIVATAAAVVIAAIVAIRHARRSRAAQ
jgi:EmrB/QacA subfamily drug resistance transporter